MEAQSRQDPDRFRQARYSLYYFFAVGFYSFILAFLPVHGKELGFTPFQIALVSMTTTLATICGAPLLQQVAHYFIPPRHLLILSYMLACIFFVYLMRIHSAAMFVPIWFGCAFFACGSSTLVDAQAVRDSAAGRSRFERIRSWGSMGFILGTIITGILVDRFGPGVIIRTALANLLICAFSAALIFTVMSPHAAGRQRAGDTGRSKLWEAMRDPSFRYLILVNALVWGSHGVLYVYLSLYLRSLGWSAQWISAAWNIGVISEILFFISFPFLERRLSLMAILRLSIIITIVRWLILAASSHGAVILASQALHSFTFGGCYLASIKLAYQLLPEDLKDRGQGLLQALGAGIGSLTGRMVAGLGASLLASYRDVNQLFIVSAAAAFLALLCLKKMPAPAVR